MFYVEIVLKDLPKEFASLDQPPQEGRMFDQLNRCNQLVTHWYVLYNLPIQLPNFHVLTIICAKSFTTYVTQKSKEFAVQEQVWGSLTW